MIPLIFGITCIVPYIFTCLLIVFFYKNQRDYWYALIGLSLCFPFEWLLDSKHGWFLKYSWDFIMFPGTRIPLVIPLAYGWFYGLALILMLRNKKRLDSLALWQQLLVLTGIFVAWDMIIEFPSTGNTCYAYYWPKEWMFNPYISRAENRP